VRELAMVMIKKNGILLAIVIVTILFLMLDKQKELKGNDYR